MTATAPTAPTARQRVADHARRVPSLNWKLLAVFMLIGVAGAALYFYGAVGRPPASGAGPATPGGASGFVGLTEPTGTSAAAADDSWTAWSGAKGAALGFGFVGGFVLGFIFRAFLKIMALLTIVAVGGLAALSYFHILNIDFTAARQAYDTHAAWLTDQAVRLKVVLMTHLPHSAGTTAGAYFGLRRK